VRRLASALAVIGAAVAVALLTGASGSSGSASGKTYKIQFDNAFGLTTGGDLKVGGVRAGKTSGFDLQKISNGRYVAVVTGKVTASSVPAFRSDASCEIRPQSLIGEYYVDCQPGSKGKVLPDGGTVPVKSTVSTVPPDLLQDVMRRPYRERFRLIIAELGTGLAGRPGDLAQVLRRADPGLRETSKVLRMLAQQNQIIKNFITNSDIVVAQLERKKKEVAHWVKAAGRTAQISATRQLALRQQWQKFPQFLAELKPTMAQLGGLADQQTPLLRQLQATAPQLKRFFADLGPFSEASRPSFRSLGKAATVGNKAFRDSRQEIDQLAQLSVHAPSAGKNLRQFLQTLDDPNRASQADTRARDSAPPAPDPAAWHNGQGFTGMESLLNYFYWQTLAINPYDSVGHLLRALLNVNSCSQWQTGPVDDTNKTLFEGCNSWLGPYQPGVTAPDPTCPASHPDWACHHIGKGLAATSLKTKRGRSGSAPIVPGQPEATKPLPGQTNPSVPQVVLPPAVQQLLNDLPKLPNVGGAIGVPPVNTGGVKDKLPPIGGVTGTGARNDQEQQKLLDFLLSP
jgi:ABC-type transporter Mla subunit MlaD